MKRQNNNPFRLKFEIISNEIVITGNEAGLRDLADVCLQIIKAPPGGEHYHFFASSNADGDSTPAMICWKEN